MHHFDETVPRRREGRSHSSRGIPGTPPVDAPQIHRYFDDLKGFSAINNLMTIVTGAVTVKAASVGGGLDRALRYGNHRSAAEHLPAIWENSAKL